MTALARRPWVPTHCEDFIQALATATSGQGNDAVLAAIEGGIALNRRIHEADCINLNPATNVMNPKAEAALAARLGSRPSLGYPGDKYEMGLEGVERIEVIAAELAAQVFGAKYAEIRVPSGAIANLYAFMVAARPGDAIIAPPPAIGGHVTHHMAGCAGLYGLEIHAAPVDAGGYTVDIERLRALALKLRPKMITIGSSLNLLPHPIQEIRAIADEVGALVLFDAAHLCGMIAGQAWQQPLEEGAHLMTMSTYKSLGGPPSGLIVTNVAEIAEKLDRIAFPGMTANFDAAKAAALAITMLDWKGHGRAYAAAMAGTAKALASALAERGLPVFSTAKGHTASHQFAIEAAEFGGGQAAAKRLRRANILTCGIGLPVTAVDGDMNGLRFGTPEIVRWGMTEKDMPELAALIARGLRGNDAVEDVAADVSAFRRRFTKLHFVS
ncbi:aminotransferase class I/II-fold pyridoxal phosphate-dependent enzyme [Mesorhizobium sp. WSM4887]|uniref:serine hydroxymethyltransferase n=1 Tax=Mesorhizobium sp. WSM4887 TaxID=3038543 RepID=UPI002415A9BD|nr:aminotransferase class I/II-fold pyridoxal phosphate-dependent enzyme [Mesorhizobium sp. WSM4887]MDG4889364.1 aminotransferase class I/II-fold pyridoxal phosphate-dependent enzyme [Mesorhizobium sp. WSM4887]